MTEAIAFKAPTTAKRASLFVRDKLSFLSGLAHDTVGGRYGKGSLERGNVLLEEGRRLPPGKERDSKLETAVDIFKKLAYQYSYDYDYARCARAASKMAEGLELLKRESDVVRAKYTEGHWWGHVAYMEDDSSVGIHIKNLDWNEARSALKDVISALEKQKAAYQRCIDSPANEIGEDPTLMKWGPHISSKADYKKVIGALVEKVDSKLTMARELMHTVQAKC
ncbi:MAG: hypothetical protein V1909_01695 [Candidatus Micrarchaeota archaeon]